MKLLPKKSFICSTRWVINPLYQLLVTSRSPFCLYLEFLFGIILRCLTRRCSGLDKAKLEVYSIMVGLYYGVDVYSASLLWEEFGNSISHSKLESGVSSAGFWGLILKEVYTQEDIFFSYGC